MSARSSTPLQLAAAIVMALLIGSGPGLAQTAGNASKPAKPATAHKRAPAKTGATQAQTDYWSVNYDVPKQYGDVVRQYDAPTGKVIETRVPLQSGPGSFGLTTEAQVNSTGLSDGRPVPGINANAYKPPSYVGLSLTVPNDSKGFPIPIPQAPGGLNQW